jgi:hypothetical protein
MDTNKAKDEERATEERATAVDVINAVPPARTADEQKRYDNLSPAGKQADDATRQAAARTKALAALPKRTKDEQKAYDALSPADQTVDDDRRLADARKAAVETPEGRAAREAHEQAMKPKA